MKKIGLIGGMSWESSQLYYRIINQKVNEELGGFHSCKSVMESVDFAEIEEKQHKNDWKALCKQMVNAAKNLESAKADLIILCTNTMHLCSKEIMKNTNLPFLHIASATGRKLKKDKVKKVLLLGTKFTMESTFYKKILKDEFGIKVVIPGEKDRKRIHKIIYTELVHGEIKNKSRKIYQEIIHKSLQKGVERVILGCTEIPLLIKKYDVPVPIYDTTKIHAESAVEYALKDR